MDYLGTVRNFVVQNFLFGDAELLEDDTSFMEKGIIDSTGILELVMFLEETYKVKVEDDELVPENLDSLENINRFLASKLSTSASSSEQGAREAAL
jgi:acyl carrier protein